VKTGRFFDSAEEAEFITGQHYGLRIPHWVVSKVVICHFQPAEE